MYDIDVWAVPVGAPNMTKAMGFPRFATSTQILADQSQYIACGLHASRPNHWSRLYEVEYADRFR